MFLDKYLQRLAVEGWCVLEGVISQADVGRIRNRVASSVAQYGSPDAPNGVGHVPGFMGVDQSLAPYLADDRVLGLAQALFGPFVKVSFTSATINYPGNDRGEWHADWPFNQTNAGHIKAPYADAVLHLTTLWMLVPFTKENGGTLLVPGTHRSKNNPTGNNGVDPLSSHPSEIQATGSAGSVMVMDSRLWHATAANVSTEDRVAVVVRYAPWWLNTRVLMPGTSERRIMVEESGSKENEVPPLSQSIFRALPEKARPLFCHVVESS